MEKQILIKIWEIVMSDYPQQYEKFLEWVIIKEDGPTPGMD